MKICPNCNAGLEDNFELCWNCSFSLTENRIIEPDEYPSGKRKINCLRCDVPLVFSGNFRFHEGANPGVFGNLFELFINKETFELYLCPKCGKVEFYSPK